MDWNASYLEGETPWDLGEPAPPLLEVLDRWSRDLWGNGAVLVPGCGRGHDAAALARAGIPAVGMDLAPSALEAAEAHHGAGDGLHWELGDFLSAEPGPDSVPVSAIFEHTCFCAIDPSQRPEYAAAAARRLQTGQRLVAIFFLDPPGEGGGPPFGASREDIRGLFGEHFRFERELGPGRSHPSREGREWVVELVRWA